MEGEVVNFGRFWRLLDLLPGAEKEVLVREYTGGRTESLREMTRQEYEALCDRMEVLSGYRDRLKYGRSLCLNLMQRMGVDTSDWARVNAFCQNPRIAGKVFARIDPDGLDALSVKLRAILRKGGLRHRNEPDGERTASVACVYVWNKNIAEV